VNWTDTDFGRGAADKVRKLAKDFVPQGLVLILRESHNMTADDIRASAMRRYPGSLARFTRNMKAPIVYEDNGPPPDIALIDAEGKLLLAGSYTVDLSRAEKLLPGELKKLKTGWGTHAAARDARALLYGQGRIAEALACCDKALSSEPDQAELLEVKGEARARFDSTLKQVSYHLDKGQCAQALALSTALVESVAGRPELEEPAAKRLAELRTPEIQHDLELEKTLAAALKPLEKNEPTAKDVEKLERLANEAGDTRVGRRAKELARVAALSIR
jgi:tetratricopeptide (TPR) repeat protein